MTKMETLFLFFSLYGVGLAVQFIMGFLVQSCRRERKLSSHSRNSTASSDVVLLCCAWANFLAAGGKESSGLLGGFGNLLSCKRDQDGKKGLGWDAMLGAETDGWLIWNISSRGWVVRILSRNVSFLFFFVRLRERARHYCAFCFAFL